jgi:DNA topoisomerase IA
LPEEITYKKKAIALRATLATLTDAQAIKAAMAELARIEMRQAMAEDARRAFLKG